MIPHKKNVPASRIFLTKCAGRGRITGCKIKNAVPMNSNGAAEIAACEIPGGDHIFASLTRRLTLAASATAAKLKLAQPKKLFTMMNDCALSPI
jgi:hypothetical protein